MISKSTIRIRYTAMMSLVVLAMFAWAEDFNLLESKIAISVQAHREQVEAERTVRTNSRCVS